MKSKIRFSILCNLKKITIICCSLCLFLGNFSGINVKASEENIDKEVPVYTLDENGEIVESNISSKELLEMLYQQDENISPAQIPDPENGSIRITPVKNGVIDRAGVAGNLVKLLGEILWESYGGGIVNALSKTVLGRAAWDSAINTTAEKMIDFVTSKYLSKSYSSAYMYKTWSDYYRCYLIYHSEAIYSDAARTNLEYFIHFQVGNEYPTGL